ncbi:MAG TPA: glycosyltransferase [Verrucomicrobiae bacterium]|jgi:glycosyltransferase involved in cell wall biosynthesis|nr:glycosyltransferase [Verrucomicrobiae bacterium]
MPPLVSVIIPTYNRRAMLSDAIDSVIRQTYGDWELIVVDDGSTDGTADDVRARMHASVRLIAQRRRGVAAARNLGVRSSHGNYIAFLDSDDFWLPRKLERQIDFMQATAAQISQTEELWIRNGIRVNPKKKHRKSSGDVFRASLELCLVSPSAVMLTRNLFDHAGRFDESFPVCEDYDLWLRIGRDHPIPLLSEPLVVKRGGHADQLSRSTWGLDRFRIRALKKLLDSGIAGEKRIWVIEAMERKAHILAAGARKRGHESEASEYTALLAEIIGELNVGSGHSIVLPKPELSSSDRSALAQPE